MGELCEDQVYDPDVRALAWLACDRACHPFQQVSYSVCLPLRLAFCPLDGLPEPVFCCQMDGLCRPKDESVCQLMDVPVYLLPDESAYLLKVLPECRPKDGESECRS